MKHIAVIGSGTMGNGIAHVFAQHQFKVNLIDISAEALQKAQHTIAKNLDRMVAKEQLTAEQKEQTLHNITLHTELEPGVQDADLVVEATTENVELKKQIFRDLDEKC